MKSNAMRKIVLGIFGVMIVASATVVSKAEAAVRSDSINIGACVQTGPWNAPLVTTCYGPELGLVGYHKKPGGLAFTATTACYKPGVEMLVTLDFMDFRNRTMGTYSFPYRYTTAAERGVFFAFTHPYMGSNGVFINLI